MVIGTKIMIGLYIALQWAILCPVAIARRNDSGHLVQQSSIGSHEISRYVESTRDRCPSNCTCERQLKALGVTCYEGYPQEVIQNIPRQTTKLIYYFPEVFDERNISFFHLSELTYLEMTSKFLQQNGHKSQITRSEIFAGLGNLTHLAIHIGLTSINPMAFAHLPSLQLLDLSHTRYLGTQGIKPVLQGLQNFSLPVQTLYLKNIQNPSAGDISRTIDIGEDIAKHLSGVPVNELDISMNGVTMLTPGLTRFLPQLTVLRSRGNLVANSRPLWMCILMDLLTHPSLRVLELGGGGGSGSHQVARRKRDLFFSDKQCFQTDHWMKFRNISHAHPSCQLVACLCQPGPEIPCQFVPTLSQLIDFNRRECYYNLVLPSPPNLNVFLFSDSALFLQGNVADFRENQTICFSETHSLRYLDFSGNDMGRDYQPGLPQIKGFADVRYFNYQRNNAVLTWTRFLSLMPNLRHLLLGTNTVRLEQDTKYPHTKNATKLKSLDLEDCDISAIPEMEFAPLRQLESLNLSRNNIHTFAINITSLVNLKLLNLSYNSIANLPENVTRVLDALAKDHNITLDLNRNPLGCDCPGIAFLEWMQNTQVHLASRETLSCRHPTIGEASLWRVSASDLRDYCFPSHLNLIVSTVLTTLAAVTVIALVIVAYRKRWTIRFYLHAARESWIRYIRRIDDSYERVLPYDAFVVYNSEDRAWVHDTLLKTLEDEHDLRLCIHFRDFLPGHDIEDTIVESINNSRKTIVVMSPNFVRSEWCQFEFKMARQKIVIDGLDVLILVLLEDLPTTGLSRTLVRLLQKKTYLQWTEDAAGRRLFWDQLVKSIREESGNDPMP